MKEKKLNYIRSLLSEFGLKLPAYPEAEEIIDALTDALEAEHARNEQKEDSCDCDECIYKNRKIYEAPCADCAPKHSHFIRRNYPDTEEGDGEDAGQEEAAEGRAEI